MNLVDIKNKLFNQIDLTTDESSYIFNLIMSGEVTEIDMVSIFPSTGLININLLSFKIKVIPPSLSGSSTSRIGCPNRPSYFAIVNSTKKFLISLIDHDFYFIRIIFDTSRFNIIMFLP